MNRIYRQGATGALLDEYEKALKELQQVLRTIPDNWLTVVVDPVTEDDNCRSIQNILSHVVHAGFGYATSIYNLKGAAKRPDKIFYTTVAEYIEQLSAMFSFTEKVLSNFEDMELEEFDDSRKILSGWGQVYDVEQMMEHAIVHVLRHRRQIQNIVLKFSEEASESSS